MVAWGRSVEGKREVNANGYTVSFWRDENVRKVHLMMLYNSVNTVMCRTMMF